jgi:hypothetical protein
MDSRRGAAAAQTKESNMRNWVRLAVVLVGLTGAGMASAGPAAAPPLNFVASAPMAAGSTTSSTIISKAMRSYEHDIVAVKGMNDRHRLLQRTLVARFEAELMKEAVADPRKIALEWAASADSRAGRAGQPPGSPRVRLGAVGQRRDLLGPQGPLRHRQGGDDGGLAPVGAGSLPYLLPVLVKPGHPAGVMGEGHVDRPVERHGRGRNDVLGPQGTTHLERPVNSRYRVTAYTALPVPAAVGRRRNQYLITQ